jgi:tetratricopeptide (TPR) repeat protein
LSDDLFPHPDELPFAYEVKNFARGYFSIPFWAFSPLWTYLYSIGVYLYSFLEGILKYPLGIRQSFIEHIDVFRIILIGRVLAGIIGAITIPIVYLIGKRLFNEKTGMISAGIMAVVYLHVAQSHYAYVDVPQTFFLTLSFYFMVKVSSGEMTPNKVRGNSFLAGVFLALAIATKISAVPGALSLIFAHYLKEREIRRLIKSRYLYISIAGLIFGYGLCTPWYLVRPAGLYRDIKGLLNLLYSPLSPATVYGQPFDILRGIKNVGTIVFEHIGIHLILLFLFVLVIIVIKKEWKVFFVLSFPLAYLPFFISATWHDQRELVPILPFLVIIIAYGISRVVDILPFSRKGIILLVFSLSIIFPSLWISLKAGYFFWQKDTRVLAAEWIKENIPPGAKIGIEGYSVYNPPIYYNGGYSLVGDFSEKTIEEAQKEIDFVVLSGIVYRQVEDDPRRRRFYDYLEEKGHLIKQFKTGEVGFANPTIKLFKISHKGGQFSSLIPRPFWEGGGIYDLSSGEGPYGKEPLSFWIGPKERIKRVILSEKGLDTVAILLYNGSEKTVLNIKGASKRRIALKPYESTVVTFKPSRSFPFIRYIYNISMSCGRGGSFVRILTEPKAIASALLESGDWERAITALKGPTDQEAYALLGLAYYRGGRWNEALESFRKGLSPSPIPLPRGERIEVRGGEWEKSFEGLTNIDSAFLRDSLTVNYNAEKLYNITGKKIGPIAYFNPEVDIAGVLLYGPYKRFPEGDFKAVFRIRVLGTGQDPAARIDIFDGDTILAEKIIKDTGGRAEDFSLDFYNEYPDSPLEFRVEALGGAELWVEGIKVFPDIQGNYKRFLGMIHHYGGLSALKSGLLEEATEHFKIASELGYKDTEGFYQMGKVYEEMGIKEEAIRVYRRVISEIPNHIDSLLALKRLSSEKEFEERIKILMPDHEIGQIFGESIKFIGYSIDKERIHPGGEFNISYFWHSLKRLRADYSIFVHFCKDGAIIFQNDHFPSPPIRQWRKGEVVREDYSVNVPLDAPAGKYNIIIGLWDPRGSKERVKLKEQKMDEIKIGSIEVF